MSFLKSLLGGGKDEPEKNPESSKAPAPATPPKPPAQQAQKTSGSKTGMLSTDLAAKVDTKSRTSTSKIIPQGEDAASVAKRRSALPTEEQRKFFDAQKYKNDRVRKALINTGLVNDQMLQDALKNEGAASLQKAVVQQGFVREDDVLEALAAELGMEKISLQDIEVTPQLLQQIDKKTAQKYRVFPVAFSPSEISIAIADPLNIQVMDDLQRILNKPVKGMVCSEDEIDRYYKRFYEGDEIKGIYQEVTDTLTKKEEDSMMEKELVLDDNLNENSPPVVRFVDLIFKYAVHDRASDIHIEPTRAGLTIRFRVDGVLTEVQSPPKKWQNAILSRLKVLSGMDLAEKRIPQDGRIKLSLPDRKLDLRVNSLPTIYGESIVMRILDQSSVLLGLEDVGFLPDNITLFNSLIRTPNGVILMTGPTGSGKTTTLYSALATLNSPEVKIVTIENPVEYMLDGINQVQVNEEIGLDFRTGLRSILRQSPDVLLVGEMRDLETAEIGIRAALTGHLVFSTLHTNDAPSAPGRLVDMGVKPFLVASSLQAVIAQRLVRRLCGSCKRPIVPTEDELIEIGASDDDRAHPDMLGIHGPVGCDRCSGAGYRGRTAIHEIMVLDARVRQMVIKGESAFRVKKVAVRGGMRSLRMDGWQKIKMGSTSLDEVARMTQGD